MRRFIIYIARQANGWNLLLAIALVLLVNATILPLCRSGAKFALPSPKGGPHGERGETPATDSNPADYSALVQENFFHPERKFPLPSKKEEKVLARPEIVLYGTYITNELKLAFIEEKGSPVFTPGRGQRHAVMKLGEQVAGFELKQIEPDRILLVRDKESMTVLLHVKKQRSSDTGQQPAGRVGMQPAFNTGRQPVPASGQQAGTGQTGREIARPAASSTLVPPPLPSPSVRAAPPAAVPPSR